MGEDTLLQEMRTADKWYIALCTITLMTTVLSIINVVAYLTLKVGVFHEYELLSSIVTPICVGLSCMVVYYASMGEKLKNFHDVVSILKLRYEHLFAYEERMSPWTTEAIFKSAESTLKDAAHEVTVCQSKYKARFSAYDRALRDFQEQSWWYRLLSTEPLAPSNMPEVSARRHFKDLHAKLFEAGVVYDNYSRYFQRS